MLGATLPAKKFKSISSSNQLSIKKNQKLNYFFLKTTYLEYRFMFQNKI